MSGRFQKKPFNAGPPATVVEMGAFVHPAEEYMVYKSTNPKIPMFNASIFLENKNEIGKLDEILGPINDVYFTVKPAEGIKSDSFKVGDKVFIDPEKLMPAEYFTAPDAEKRAQRGGMRGGMRGGRGGRGGGGFRGGRGGAPGGGFRGGRGGAPGGGFRGGFRGGRGGAPGGGFRGGRGGGFRGGRGGPMRT